MTKFLASASAAALALASALPAAASDWYVSGSAGAAFQADSDNDGQFSSDFTTGDGGAVPAGTVLPAGTPLGWSTEFDTGYAVSAAVGRSLDNNWRVEGELSYSNADVDTHTGVTVGGTNIDAVDAGVLITGSPQLGATVGDIVADGQGSIEGLYLMGNVYYDFKQLDWPITPYVGVGVGFGQVKVDYSPSGVQIIDDQDTVFAYQALAGATYQASQRVEVFAQARYRASQDIQTRSDLLPASLDIENQAAIVEAGVRIRF